MISLLLVLVLSQNKICIQDEGVNKGCVPYINCTGSGVSCSVSGKVATFTGSGADDYVPFLNYSELARPFGGYCIPLMNSGSTTWRCSWDTVVISASVTQTSAFETSPNGNLQRYYAIAPASTVNGDTAYVGHASPAPASMTTPNEASIQFKTQSNFTNTRLWVTPIMSAMGNASLDSPHTSGVNIGGGVRYSPATAGDTVFMCCTVIAATSTTCVSSGVTPVVSTRYHVKTTLTGTDTWTVYINGTQVCQQTATLAASSNGGMSAIQVTNAGVPGAAPIIPVYGWAWKRNDR